MGRDRSESKKQKCYNPTCGNLANVGDKTCYLEADNCNKIFCSPSCGEHYLENIEQFTKAERYQKALERRKQRYKQSQIKALIEAIYLCSDETFDKQKIEKVVRQLELESRWIDKKMSDLMM